MSVLVITPSVPMALTADGPFLDIKAVQGLALYARLWPGPVRCLMRTGPKEAIGFGRVFQPAELPCEVRAIGNDISAHRDAFEGASVVLAAGDSHLDFDIPKMTPAPVVFIIEYTLATRLRIAVLDHGRSVKTVKTAIWTMLAERKRRRAFRQAAGLQANGTPAFDAYRLLSADPLLYFDSRLGDAEQITSAELAAKVDRLATGAPLRLAFSGRLEPMKGADHLVPVARALKAKGVAFTLDIYGNGSLADPIAAAIRNSELSDHVFLRGAVPFNEALVPALKSAVDLFICCHRQADPSCTYQETMGCGVPIVGYDNAAFTGLLLAGGGGIATPMDQPERVAEVIADLDRRRDAVVALMEKAAVFGRTHSMEAGLAARVRQLERISGSKGNPHIT